MSDILRFAIPAAAARAMYPKACPDCGRVEANTRCTRCDAFKFPLAVAPYAHELAEDFVVDQPVAA